MSYELARIKKSLMMEIIACPRDKQYPLELFEVSSREDDIIEGVLFCRKCWRFYLIIDGIPIMLPDDLREKEPELNVLRKWRGKLPSEITEKGNPWHI